MNKTATNPVKYRRMPMNIREFFAQWEMLVLVVATANNSRLRK